MLSTWNAFSAFDRLIESVMDDVVSSAFGARPFAAMQTSEVGFEVSHGDNEIVCRLDVPGVKREELDVVVENGVLTVNGKRRLLHRGNDAYATIRHALALPEYADIDGLRADLADGVLTITIPKHPQAQPRRIEIQAAPSTKQLTEKSS